MCVLIMNDICQTFKSQFFLGNGLFGDNVKPIKAD